MIADRIKAALRAKGYKYFASGLWNLNIVGVRSNLSRVNYFDDRLHVLFRDHSGEERCLSFAITCDPGHYWLRNPGRVEGTAILVPGQYRGVYKIDKHRGQYDALCQRNGKVKVYRDRNRDEQLDMDPSTIQEGYYGINIHKSGFASQTVEKWSAGCQVFQHAHEWDIVMSLCRLSAARYGNAFTYTLLLEADL